MKIVRPYAKILSLSSPNPLHAIESAARVSHRSEEEQTAGTTERFIRAVVLKHGDWSVVEHVSASVEMLVDRGITHELVRHRLFGFTQESTRFVNYEKKMPPSFIYPIPGVECNLCTCHNEVEPTPIGTDTFSNFGHTVRGGWLGCNYDANWLSSIHAAEKGYKNLITNGWRPQEARSVFPNALASKIIITGNLRNWRHFFLMRTTKEAHPQMRQVTIPLLKEFQELAVGVLFEDIVPEARQADNIAKGR